jgi:hypothetical protein
VTPVPDLDFRQQSAVERRRHGHGSGGRWRILDKQRANF